MARIDRTRILPNDGIDEASHDVCDGGLCFGLGPSGPRGGAGDYRIFSIDW